MAETMEKHEKIIRKQEIELQELRKIVRPSNIINASLENTVIISENYT